MPEFRRHRRAAPADHDHRDQHRTHLAQQRHHDQIGHVDFRAELLERMRRLHRQRHADAERGQRDHRRRAHPDEDHLPEDRRDLEELAFERRDQDPVKQASVEPEKVFQDARQG